MYAYHCTNTEEAIVPRTYLLEHMSAGSGHSGSRLTQALTHASVSTRFRCWFIMGDSRRMEILGHGVDLVSLSHVERLLGLDAQVPGDWLTGEELALAPEEHHHKVAFYAGRIAAKEAIVKAIGTGFSGDITWSDVEILADAGGAPVVHLHGSVQALAVARSVARWFISISHTEEHALASVIAIRRSLE